MPKIGMEPIRRAALIEATIAEIGSKGSMDVTVAAIAKRAGMSTALAHHYFGGKIQIFLAAMRHTLTLYGAEVKSALALAKTPQERVSAIVRASFAPVNFQRDVVAAWLNFYVLAQTDPLAMRLLRIYQLRLRSNLTHSLRPLFGSRAPEIASCIAALIDGVYLRQGLGKPEPDRHAAADQVLGYLSSELKARSL